MTGILEFIRSLGFGGLLGAGITGLIYSLSPTVFASVVTFQQILIVGGLLGAGLHGFIDRTIGQSILGRIGKQISFYSRIGQVLLMRKAGLISKKHANELTVTVIDQHVLPPSESKPSQKALPPGRKDV